MSKITKRDIDRVLGPDEKNKCRAFGPFNIDNVEYFLIPWEDLKKCKIEIIIHEQEDKNGN
jgi:hypothetical protein